MQDQNLPFPANQLIGGNWFENPMNAQLPVPANPVFQQNPNISWVLALTAGLLVTNLQNNSNGGPVSCFAYNLFSSNQYNNQPWLIIVDEASDFALQQLQQNPNANAQQVVQAAVTFYAGYAAAACVMKWPVLQTYMQPQQVARVQQIINEWASLNAPIQHQQQQYAQNNPQNFTVSTGNGITSPHAGSYAFSMPMLDEKSKFGHADRKRAVPDALRKKAQPNDELQSLGVTETSGIGDRQVLHNENVQVTQDYIPPVHRPRARPKPQPLNPDAAPAPTPEWPLPEQAQQIPTSVQFSQGQQEFIPRELPLDSDIPSLDILGDDSQWADQIEKGNFDFGKTDHVPAPAYKVEGVGRFVVRPKHPDVLLPLTRTEAELEEEDDLEILEVHATPQGDNDFTVLELDDGNVAVQVLHDDTGRTWTEDQPHNHPYDPKLHYRYLVHIDEKLAYEAFMPRDPDVKYEDLEFDVSVRAKARQERLSDKMILGDLSVLSEITPRGAPYTIIGAVENLDRANVDADQSKGLEAIEQFQGKLTWFEGIQTNTTLSSMLFEMDKFFERVKARNAVAVAYGQSEERFIVEGLGKKVSTLNTSAIKERLAKIILFVRDLEMFGPRAFLHVNQILTRVVNRSLDARLGFTAFSITSFAEDYFELLEEVEKDYGTSAFDKLNDVVNNAVAHITFDYEGTCLTVKQTYSVIGLPVGMASFGLHTATGESYVVLSNIAGELHTLLDESKADDGKPKAFTTYLHGRDGEVFEVIESAWDSSFKTLVRV